AFFTKMKNASYCVSYGKERRLQQNEQKISFCYSHFFGCARHRRALMNESFWTARWQHIGSPLLMLIEEDRVLRGMRFF
ncbi:hypothetical protein, partial [uncultured Megasphaera sp.]|uniref:hypothetical protein n=1 Tax=uncultured Megasphaera sp. TaxID=165188 RepID=UPI0026089A89